MHWLVSWVIDKMGYQFELYDFKSLWFYDSAYFFREGSVDDPEGFHPASPQVDIHCELKLKPREVK